MVYHWTPTKIITTCAGLSGYNGRTVMMESVFGYGSLVDTLRLASFLGRGPLSPTDWGLTQLHGYRRCWNVAMDNRVDLPDYKYYLDALTGERPPWYVTFLNIYPQAETVLSGIMFQLSGAELAKVDGRERNYRRVEVTAHVVNPLHRVWAYIGLPEAERRYQTGVKAGRAVISQSYYQQVYQAYQQHGAETLAAYLASTDAPTIPQRALMQQSQTPIETTLYLSK